MRYDRPKLLRFLWFLLASFSSSTDCFFGLFVSHLNSCLDSSSSSTVSSSSSSPSASFSSSSLASSSCLLLRNDYSAASSGEASTSSLSAFCCASEDRLQLTLGFTLFLDFRINKDIEVLIFSLTSRQYLDIDVFQRRKGPTFER